MSKFSWLEVLMVCKLLSSPKASGVGAQPGKGERVWTLLFSECEHRQGQPKNLIEADKAGNVGPAFVSKASRVPKELGST